MESTSAAYTNESTWLPEDVGQEAMPGHFDRLKNLQYALRIRSWYVGVVLWLFFWIILGVPANFASILAFIKSRLLHKSRPVNHLIFNLAVSDFVTCFLSMFYVITNFTDAGKSLSWKYKYACVASLWAVHTCLMSSVVSILLLSVERLIAIVSPLGHMRWVTNRSVRVTIVISWVLLAGKELFTFVWSVWRPGVPCIRPLVYHPVFNQYVHDVPFYICLTLIPLCNITIAIIARQRVRASTTLNETPNKDESKAQQKVDGKLLKMVLMVVGIFYLTWVPTKIMASVVKLYYPPHPHSELVLKIHHASKGLLLMGLVADPLVYLRQNAQFRKAFFGLLLCPRMRTTHPAPGPAKNPETTKTSSMSSLGTA